MSERLAELAARAAGRISEDSKQTCPTCHRGAAEARVPSLDDLEAMIEIRDGFNTVRREFTPDIEDRFRRFDSVISYMHRLIAGTKHG